MMTDHVHSRCGDDYLLEAQRVCGKEKPAPRCPYCGGEATLIEGYWQTGNEYRAKWVCTKEDAASQLVRAKHRKDAVDKALEAANQSPWEPYSVVDPFSKKADKQKRSDAFHDLAGEDQSPAPSRA